MKEYGIFTDLSEDWSVQEALIFGFDSEGEAAEMMCRMGIEGVIHEIEN